MESFVLSNRSVIYIRLYKIEIHKTNKKTLKAKKMTVTFEATVIFLAEREGFEPSVATRTTTVFETVPFNHSGISPVYVPCAREIIP